MNMVDANSVSYKTFKKYIKIIRLLMNMVDANSVCYKI